MKGNRTNACESTTEAMRKLPYKLPTLRKLSLPRETCGKDPYPSEVSSLGLSSGPS